MQQILFGIFLGGLVGTVPGVLCFLVREDLFWGNKLVFVILGGTASLIGAITGATLAVLDEFERSQQFRVKDRGRQSSKMADKADQPAPPRNPS